MHLYLYVRGLPQWVGMWEAFAQSQFYKWRRIDTRTGQEQLSLVQGALRKSVLGTYEYVFPKEALPTILAIIGVCEGDMSVEPTLKNKINLIALRKMIGCKKIPSSVFKEAGKIVTSLILNDSERGLTDFRQIKVSPHLIGIKDDKMGEMKDFDPETKEEIVWFQELL